MAVQVRSLFRAPMTRRNMGKLKKKIETELQNWEAFSRDYIAGFKGYAGTARYENGRIDAYKQILDWMKELNKE
jgi:hypothetical protein